MVKVLELSSPKENEVGDEVGPYEMHEVIGKQHRKGERAQGTEEWYTLDAILGCKPF
jgi:hypothetical protein